MWSLLWVLWVLDQMLRNHVNCESCSSNSPDVWTPEPEESQQKQDWSRHEPRKTWPCSVCFCSELNSINRSGQFIRNSDSTAEVSWRGFTDGSDWLSVRVGFLINWPLSLFLHVTDLNSFISFYQKMSENEQKLSCLNFSMAHHPSLKLKYQYNSVQVLTVIKV